MSVSTTFIEIATSLVEHTIFPDPSFVTRHRRSPVATKTKRDNATINGMGDIQQQATSLSHMLRGRSPSQSSAASNPTQSLCSSDNDRSQYLLCA